MKMVISEHFETSREEIRLLLEGFDSGGDLLVKGDRNKIKLFELQGMRVNIKSFKIPNPVNKVAYKFFRKSKAERSFCYAQKLLSKNINTPRPIAYAEEASATFTKSFYISEHLNYDLTYRELVHQTDFPDRENLLRAFTRFTFDLHEKQVEFLDHSPGNTLIRRNNGDYKFYLVDLNRMNFNELDFDARMKNFSRLTPKKEMVKLMAVEYARLIGKPKDEVFDRMWFFTQDFQKKFRRKKMLKKKLKFWKK